MCDFYVCALNGQVIYEIYKIYVIFLLNLHLFLSSISFIVATFLLYFTFFCCSLLSTTKSAFLYFVSVVFGFVAKAPNHFLLLL